LAEKEIIITLIVKKLLSDYAYTDEEALAIAEKLLELKHPYLAILRAEWLGDGIENDYVIGGVSLAKIKKPYPESLIELDKIKTKS